jgi:2-keto-4-pentenoate hydratase/2-oxohepta-3-ene-1,7-dioic acid hydratase in catechol pathway
MKLVTFRRNPATLPEPGLLEAGSVRPLPAPSLLHAIAHGVPEPTAELLPLPSVQLLAPILHPPKIICIGLNYRDHAEESNMKIPDRPTVFNKFPTSLIGPGEPIILPKASTQPDYEAELGIVIGKRARYLSRDNWREAVFGYTCIHDVSARDFQLATSQWLMGKTFDTFCPTGPAIVTADEIPDPHALDIRCIVSGEVLQDSNTRHLIFDIPTILEHLSSVFTLEPGDLIATGTPAGVGFARKPPRYLQPGDTVTISIQGVGDLTNPVIAEPGTH